MSRTVETALLGYMERHGEISVQGLAKHLGIDEGVLVRMWDEVFRRKGQKAVPRRVRVPKEYTQIFKKEVEAQSGNVEEEVREGEERAG